MFGVMENNATNLDHNQEMPSTRFGFRNVLQQLKKRRLMKYDKLQQQDHHLGKTRHTPSI